MKRSFLGRTLLLLMLGGVCATGVQATAFSVPVAVQAIADDGSVEQQAAALFRDPLLTKLKRGVDRARIAACPDADLRALALQLLDK